jgi:hypothetical protein
MSNRFFYQQLLFVDFNEQKLNITIATFVSLNGNKITRFNQAGDVTPSHNFF